MFSSQPPWWVAGPLLGLCVVLMYLAANMRLGVVGGLSDVLERGVRIGTRGSFVVGIVLGGLLFGAVHGFPIVAGYGWLTREFDTPTALAALVASGMLIGYGAKSAGGCTSGNGLCGNAIGSPASAVATATFFGTAVLVSLATEALL